MNSSFLSLGQFLLGTFSAVQTVLLVLQFGIPRDIPRVLGYLLSGAITAFLLVEGVGVFGFFPIFHFNSAYGVLLGLLAFGMPAFTYLGVVDQPSQIQRKVMWRFPIMGMLIGYWLNASFMLIFFVAGWIAALVMIISSASLQRYVLRLFVGQFTLSILYYLALKSGFWWVAQILNVFWLVVFHRFINAFLVKNLARRFVPVPTGGATT